MASAAQDLRKRTGPRSTMGRGRSAAVNKRLRRPVSTILANRPCACCKGWFRGGITWFRTQLHSWTDSCFSMAFMPVEPRAAERPHWNKLCPAVGADCLELLPCTRGQEPRPPRRKVTGDHVPTLGLMHLYRDPAAFDAGSSPVLSSRNWVTWAIFRAFGRLCAGIDYGACCRVPGGQAPPIVALPA